MQDVKYLDFDRNSPTPLEVDYNNESATSHIDPLECSKTENIVTESKDQLLDTIDDTNKTILIQSNDISNSSELLSPEENCMELCGQDDIIGENLGLEDVDGDQYQEVPLERTKSPSEQEPDTKDCSTCDIRQAEIQSLEKALIQTEQKSTALQCQMEETISKLTEQNIRSKSGLLERLETVTKTCEMADRDKQTMVIKYANSEKEVIVVKKQLTSMEKSLRDANKDKETLQRNTRSLTQENTRKTNAYDKKVQEYGQLSRQLDKLKEEINARDIKTKWREHKLQTEVDAHKETQQKLDRELQHRKCHEGEMALVRKEACQLVAATKGDELSRANVLDKLHQEIKARLIMEEQRNSDLNSAYSATTSELNTLRDIYTTQLDEMTVLRAKVFKYEFEREESEKLVTSLQAEITTCKINETNLSKLVSTSSGFSEQLKELKKEYHLSCETVKDLREKLDERETEYESNRKHEQELLEFTQKISDKDAVLQSQLSATKTKVEEIELENEQIILNLSQVRNENEILTKQLSDVRCSKETEVNKLDEDYKSLDGEHSKLKTLASDLKNELTIQQRKYQNMMKDSNREVIKLSRKLELLESKQSPPQDAEVSEPACDSEHSSSPLWNNSIPQDSLSRSSNASSNTSLNNIDGANCPAPLKELLSNQVLLEKLLKLQKRHIKKEEKVEFLEEHMTQLVDELKRKNKLLNHYFLKEEPGALSSNRSDNAKAQIMKKGGIMASVYGSSLKDDTMTLELSLEINKKLQALLEDTLLKNITLKENLNTLADEVATLTTRKSST